jgi:Transcriptional regulator, AbiEi antitoxin
VDAERLRSIARRQLGLFTRAQAGECGFSAAQIRRRMAAGLWRPVRRTVLAEPGLKLTPKLRDRAAQLAVPGSVLAAFSAAREWDMPMPDLGPHLIVPGRVHVRPDGVRIMRLDLSDRDVSIAEGALVTSPPRTVFVCLRLLDDGPAGDLLDRALQEGWIGLPDLVERVRAGTGCRGAPRLARPGGLAALLAEAGWSGVGWRNLTGGIVALHRATRARWRSLLSAAISGRRRPETPHDPLDHGVSVTNGRRS